VNPYLELAVLATQQRRWKEVAGLTGEALRLDPLSYPKMYFLDAVAHLNLGKLDQAEKSAREGLNLDPHNRIPSLNQVLGVILANKGEHKQAARFMKAYLELAPNASDAAQARKQLAEVEKAAQSQPATAP
jgi:tetratricopeptide (TPR) repeat protein